MNRKKSILIVDDDTEDHLILQMYLEDLGIERDRMTFAVHGKHALEYLDHTPAHQLPGLIVLDLNMPILNGTQTLIKLKEEPRYKNIPVVMFSTSENEHEKRKCLSFGAEEYCIKPVRFEQGEAIAKKINSYLE
jgi:CheY-like chemotaxis protein